ncbi:DUF1642 domain-containing protein [Lactococcus garvieae subsp. garvieae]|uniref:DUF1642 domain-containing protein n=1 Tax=Lactococcus garvieae TaxID=1363 RepID=UPI00069320D2|nr:DUF1642 domain-containing protein [Lactococcus garvieae]KAA8718802.1 DUF1642 domain-containing protein [Lactococcus garvieae subsp. garvieae]MDG6191159.1 DUF1642 domain-containing protein [Lactococcus garvieae]PCS00309.1 hypothetical protein RU85_GL000729 [Lactococcus garvieae]QPR48994.1 DUF1642 domain-containing protein [Lactococcus garvieae]
MKKFAEKEVKRPTATSLIPVTYRENVLKELSKAVNANYTKNAQILREHKEYIYFLESRLKECENLRIEANNEAAKEYALKCEVVEDRAELKREIDKLKSQLENQQPEIPEVPQFVADWLESDDLEDLIDDWYNHTSQLPEKVRDYLDSLGEDVTTSEDCYKETVHLIARAKIDDYTVAKEKRFYLRNKLTGRYLYIGICGEYREEEDTTGFIKSFQFTQQDINRMETGSYEQIEVKE